MCKALDEQRRERYVRRTLWAILLLSPLIAVWIMGAVTGTSVTRLDAYNTTWNDEIGYLRAVRTMRTQGLPTGVQSYNEVASDIPAYGAYIFLTYLPYAAMSFLTGLTSHNFMYYCNVLLVVLANAVFLRLVKPDIKKTIWLIALSTLSLVYERYVWSGMSEASYCAFLIVVLACFLWLLDGREHPHWKENVILVGVTLLILFFGMLRAFHYAWILIPGYYILISDRSRRVKTVSFLGGMAAVILCFCCSQYLSAHWAAVFFSDTGKITETLVGYLQLLSSGLGGLRQFLSQVLQINISAVSSVIESLKGGKFAGVVLVTVFVQELLLLAETIRGVVRKDWRTAWLMGLTFAIGGMIYEANIVLYSVDQCPRMMLSFVVFAGYLICMKAHPVSRGVRQGAETALVVAALCLNTSSFSIPQTDNGMDIDDLTSTLAEVLELDEDDAWGNTIAKPVESSHLQTTICLPVYMNTSTCTKSYLSAAIANDTLKSKYLMLPDGNSLNTTCEEKYEIVWQGDGHTIYQVWADGDQD
ncbi:MAG: hypothetical protein LUH48_06460 [Clostridiales bacterium]|nr:hypothetical protein [Clostridiales bacterium]